MSTNHLHSALFPVEEEQTMLGFLVELLSFCSSYRSDYWVSVQATVRISGQVTIQATVQVPLFKQPKHEQFDRYGGRRFNIHNNIH